MSGHSPLGLTLLAAFSDTAHMQRGKTRCSLGNKSQHNHTEQKLCSFCFFGGSYPNKGRLTTYLQFWTLCGSFSSPMVQNIKALFPPADNNSLEVIPDSFTDQEELKEKRKNTVAVKNLLQHTFTFTIQQPLQTKSYPVTLTV